MIEVKDDMKSDNGGVFSMDCHKSSSHSTFLAKNNKSGTFFASFYNRYDEFVSSLRLFLDHIQKFAKKMIFLLQGFLSFCKVELQEKKMSHISHNQTLDLVVFVTGGEGAFAVRIYNFFIKIIIDKVQTAPYKPVLTRFFNPQCRVYSYQPFPVECYRRNSL